MRAIEQVAKITRESDSQTKLNRKHFKDFFLKFQNDRLVRCAAHIVINAIYSGSDKKFDKVLVKKSISGINFKIYSKDSDVLNDIRSCNEEPLDFYPALIRQMKKYHSYIDYGCAPAEVIDKGVGGEKTIYIFIDNTEKDITTDPDLRDSFDRFSNLLLTNAISKEATFMDVFFLLAYHTVDSIRNVSREEMPNLFEESIRELHNEGLDNKPSESEMNHNTGQNNPMTERKIHISELLGCYLDYSNQNCSISKDNNVIYLCKENISKFSSEFEDFTESLMFDLVFGHEVGHLIFSYLDYDNTDRKLSEGRANFFASYLMNLIGDDYDRYIIEKTKRQPDAYKFPVLITRPNWKGLLNLN